VTPPIAKGDIESEAGESFPKFFPSSPVKNTSQKISAQDESTGTLPISQTYIDSESENTEDAPLEDVKGKMDHVLVYTKWLRVYAQQENTKKVRKYSRKLLRNALELQGMLSTK
jgi:hypothetical protein